MNDHEQLKLAAAAADIFLTPEKLAEVFPDADWCETDEPYFTEHGAMVGTVVWYASDGVELGGTKRLEWDPLNDDGDALRLAVKLKIHPETFEGYTIASYQPNVDSDWLELEVWGDDPYAATRRAIVRAAAAIGEALKASPQSPRPAPGNTAR